MFFILISINLILYIMTGFLIYDGNIPVAIIFGVIAVAFTILTYLKYKRRKTKADKKDSNWECMDCGCDALTSVIPKKLDCDCGDCNGAVCSF